MTKITQVKPKTSDIRPRPECLVSGYLATMLSLSRCVGLAPLTFIKKQQGWSIRLSRPWSVYGYIVITITGVISIITVVLDSYLCPELSVRMQTSLHRFLSIINLIFLLTITSLGVYRAPSLMKTMISCLNFVTEINDDIIETYDSSKYLKKWNMLLVTWFPFTLLVAIIKSLVSIRVFDFSKKDYYNIFSFSIRVMYLFVEYRFLILFIQKFQIIMLTFHVSNTFKAINNDLRTIIMDVSPSSAPLYNRRVRRLSSAYVSICDVVRELNRSYGLILFLMLILSVKDLNVTLYFLIKNLTLTIVGDVTADKIIFIMLEIVWSVYNIVNVVLLIEPCHVTHAEMATTAELVGVLMRDSYSTYQPLAVELEAFHRLLVLNQASYAPLGVTTMSRGILLSIFGSFATYLVILLQIG